MEWIQQAILHTSLDCECEEDALRGGYGITVNINGAFELMQLLPSRPRAGEQVR